MLSRVLWGYLHDTSCVTGCLGGQCVSDLSQLYPHTRSAGLGRTQQQAWFVMQQLAAESQGVS